MLQIFHDAGAGGLFEKAGEVAFAQKEVVGQLLDGDFFGIISLRYWMQSGIS